jgi:hypothetical protein
MRPQEERRGKNEALFREVNESVAEVAMHFLGDGESQTEPIGFICECGRADCAEPITMTVDEYEAIRTEPIHFAVAPAHERLEIESVVERHPSYFVVEKRDEEAQEAARKTDPRR